MLPQIKLLVLYMAKYVITQLRSTICLRERIKENLKSLGLKKIGSTVTVEKTPSSDGLVRKVAHLVKVEVIQ